MSDKAFVPESIWRLCLLTYQKTKSEEYDKGTENIMCLKKSQKIQGVENLVVIKKINLRTTIRKKNV